MAGKFAYGNPVPVSDLASAVLDPVMRKRAGMTVSLVQSWEEIVGPRLAATSMPQKIQWQRRASEGDPFEPAVLVVAAEGLAALRLQHEASEVVARVNAFLGYGAIARIRILQRPIARVERPRRPLPAPLDAGERARLAGVVGGIEDEGLRAALERLGRNVVGEKKLKR